MEIKLRPANERGHTATDWLDSYHSFSFADYRSAEHIHFRALRVINQDIIQPATGFPLHSHQDMEIITYILQGSLKHQDSLGNHGVIQKGELQRMTAGTGIQHGEYNASNNDIVELLQIWIFPEKKNLSPSYEQKQFPLVSNQLQLLASKTGEQSSLTIHQNVKLFRGLLNEGQKINYKVDTDNGVWIQQISGKTHVNDLVINAGDGVSIEKADQINIFANQNTEFLLFDFS